MQLTSISLAVTRHVSDVVRIPWVPAWTQIGSDIPGETWQDVASGNGKVIAVASTGAVGPNRITLSTDGLSWTNATTQPLSGILLKGLAYGEGTWVVVANSLITNPNGAYSTDDGVTWTQFAVGTYVAVNAVAYGNGVFVAVGGSGAVMRSANGITWATVSSGNTNMWNGIAYGAGRFVAVASTGTGTRIMFSDDDGATWSTAATYPEETQLRAITYGSGKFVLVCSTGTTYRSMYSSDGETWLGGDISIGIAWFDVAYGNGTFVAVPNASNACYYSYDGITWLTGGVLPESGNWRCNTFLPSVGFVAINQAGTKKSAIAAS